MGQSGTPEDHKVYAEKNFSDLALFSYFSRSFIQVICFIITMSCKNNKKLNYNYERLSEGALNQDSFFKVIALEMVLRGLGVAPI